jgi:histone H3/H4
MGKRTTAIPKAPVARILINAGAKRVSAGAVDTFTEILEEISMAIGQQAVRIAKHAGRKTVQEGDVKLANK